VEILIKSTQHNVGQSLYLFEVEAAHQGACPELWCSSFADLRGRTLLRSVTGQAHLLFCTLLDPQKVDTECLPSADRRAFSFRSLLILVCFFLTLIVVNFIVSDRSLDMGRKCCTCYSNGTDRKGTCKSCVCANSGRGCTDCSLSRVACVRMFSVMDLSHLNG